MMTAFDSKDFETSFFSRLRLPGGLANGANAAYLHRNSLKADEFGRPRQIAFHFKTQFDRFADADHQLIERAGLSMTARQFWNTGHVIPFGITLEDHVELANGCAAHRIHVAVCRRRRKAET